MPGGSSDDDGGDILGSSSDDDGGSGSLEPGSTDDDTLPVGGSSSDEDEGEEALLPSERKSRKLENRRQAAAADVQPLLHLRRGPVPCTWIHSPRNFRRGIELSGVMVRRRQAEADAVAEQEELTTNMADADLGLGLEGDEGSSDLAAVGRRIQVAPLPLPCTRIHPPLPPDEHPASLHVPVALSHAC